MGKSEFFLLLPAIVYGVSVVDLLKIFNHKRNYWEMVAWGIMLMMYIITIWLELWAKLDTVANDKYYFISIIIHAIFLTQASTVLTPEEKDNDTKEYFGIIRSKFFIILTLVVVVNMLQQELFYDDQRPLIIRISFLLLFVMCILIDKVWVRTLSFTLVMGLLFYIISNIS